VSFRAGDLAAAQDLPRDICTSSRHLRGDARLVATRCTRSAAHDRDRPARRGPATLVAAAGSMATHVQVGGGGELELMARQEGGRATMAVVRTGGVIMDIPLLLGNPMPFEAWPAATPR